MEECKCIEEVSMLALPPTLPPCSRCTALFTESGASSKVYWSILEIDSTWINNRPSIDTSWSPFIYYCLACVQLLLCTWLQSFSRNNHSKQGWFPVLSYLHCFKEYSHIFMMIGILLEIQFCFANIQTSICISTLNLLRTWSIMIFITWKLSI